MNIVLWIGYSAVRVKGKAYKLKLILKCCSILLTNNEMLFRLIINKLNLRLYKAQILMVAAVFSNVGPIKCQPSSFKVRYKR